MDALVDFMLRQDPALVVVLLVVLSALENVFPPVPADLAAALGAFWAVRSGHSPIWVGLVCFLANQGSAIWVYAVAKSKGPAILRSRLFRSLVPPGIQPLVARNIARFGSLGVFISRFLPGLRAAVLPLAAIHGVSATRALIPAAAASFLWYALLTIIGSALGLAYDGVKKTVGRVTGSLGVAGVVLFVALVVLLLRARKKADLEAPPPNSPV